MDKLSELKVYQKTNKLIDHACEEVSRISRNMMHKALTENGLIPTLEDLAVSNNEAHKIKVDTEFRGVEERMDETTEVMVYRIIQELFNNVIKHANANKLFLQLVKSKGNLFILVEDNGKGFDTSKLEQKKGMGIHTIEKRLTRMDGSLSIDSKPGQGTAIIIDIPL